MPKQVFISYSSKDQLTAEEICRLLEQKDIACWIAPRDITPGKNYGAEIITAIESTHAMVVILSEYANESTHVRNEVERAVSKSKTVFPVRIREVQPSKALELFIATTHWVDAWTPPIEAKIERLSAAIKELLAIKKNQILPNEHKVNNRFVINDISQQNFTIQKVESDSKKTSFQFDGLPSLTARFVPVTGYQIKTGFSILTPVIDRENGKKYLIKRIPQNRIFQPLDMYARMRIDGTDIVFPIFHWEEGDTYNELLPMINGWTFAEIMTLNKGIYGEYLTHWTRALLDLVKILQQNNPPLIHRDIKPANIMVRQENLSSLVLIDCTTMVQYPAPDNLPKQGTSGYSAPEAMKGTLPLASDLYSIGCTIYNLNRGQIPPSPNQIKHFGQAMKLVNAEHEVEEIFSRLVALDTKDRFPDAATALNAIKKPDWTLCYKEFENLILPDGRQIEQGGWF